VGGVQPEVSYRQPTSLLQKEMCEELRPVRDDVHTDKNHGINRLVTLSRLYLENCCWKWCRPTVCVRDLRFILSTNNNTSIY